MTIDLLLPASIVGYIVAIVLAAIGVFYRAAPALRATSLVIVTTWLLHGAVVVTETIRNGHLPLGNLAEYLVVVAWIVLTLHLFLWFRLKVHVVGLVLPTISGLAVLASLQLTSAHRVESAARPDGWFLFHTTVSTLGMATLCVAFTMSVLYLIQDRALKRRKTLGLLERLPSLQKADQVGFRALIVGFILLTLGIGTGIVVNAELYHRLLVMGPKQIFPVLAWIVFAAILVARPALGFRGRKSAYLTITGFALGILTVIGMTL